MPCFTPGIAIATPMGERAVEDLRPGDRIVTRDHGIREVSWVGCRALGGDSRVFGQHLQPVLVTKGSLGEGLPERDMMVSPYQRILVSGTGEMPGYEAHEALIPARHLVNGRTIRKTELAEVAYVHVMCARHEVVLANGNWVECFQPSDVSLNGFGDAQRNEICDLFPELGSDPKPVAGQGRKRVGSQRR